MVAGVAHGNGSVGGCWRVWEPPQLLLTSAALRYNLSQRKSYVNNIDEENSEKRNLPFNIQSCLHCSVTTQHIHACTHTRMHTRGRHTIFQHRIGSKEKKVSDQIIVLERNEVVF